MAKPLLPAAYINFKDGQLPKGPLPSGLFIFIGVGNGSAANGVVTPVSSPNDIDGLFGQGPLARDLASAFLNGLGGIAYAIQLPSSTAGTIGSPTVGGFTAGALTGTVRNAFDVRVKPVIAGGFDVAQVAYSLDGGETWGAPQVLKSGANEIVGPGGYKPGLNFTTTLANVALTTAEFSCSTVAPKASDAEILAAMDTAIQDASLFFNGFHISHQHALTADLAVFAAAVQAKLVAAESTWHKYLYAVLQAPLVVTTGATALTAAQALRAAFAGNRVQVCMQPMVMRSLGGSYVMNASSAIIARRASLNPQSDLAMVRAGALPGVVKYPSGWTDASITAIDQIRNVVTIRRHVGASGFYFTGDWMTDPTSDYKKSCFRLVADLVAADLRVAGLPFTSMDIDPDDVEGAAASLLQAARVPMDIRQSNKNFSRYELTVPEGQDILASEELVVEVALVPMAHASWIRFNMGFKSPFAGG